MAEKTRGKGNCKLVSVKYKLPPLYLQKSIVAYILLSSQLPAMLPVKQGMKKWLKIWF